MDIVQSNFYSLADFNASILVRLSLSRWVVEYKMNKGHVVYGIQYDFIRMADHL